MRSRLPLTVLLCIALVATFAVPAAADGPVGEGDLAAQAFWATRSGPQPWQRGRIAATTTSRIATANIMRSARKVSGSA